VNEIYNRHLHNKLVQLVHPIMKFHGFGLTEAFEKTKDLLVGRKEDITIKISYCLMTIAEFIETTINLEMRCFEYR
jgi:hypothetical protein